MSVIAIVSAMTRTRPLRLSAFLVFLLAKAVGDANALDYPKQIIKVVVPFAAAGVTDIVARVVFDRIARTEPPPELDQAAQAAFIAKSQALAPQYRTELLPPPGGPR